MKNKLRTIVVVGYVMFSCGCVSVSTGGFEVSVREGGTGAPSVRVDDRFFSRQFSVESAVVRREPSGLSLCEVKLRNLRREDVLIQYKYAFFDNDGVEILPDGRAWEQKTIHAGEVVQLSTVAPDKSAVWFVVRVRRATI